MLKFMKNRVFKKYFCVIVCLLIAGNVSQGVVVCFGSDGHVAVEGAFHEDHCGGTGHNEHSEHDQPTFEHVHGHEEHCHPCVDVPIPVDAAKTSRFSQDHNFALFVPSIASLAGGDVCFSAFTSTTDYSVDSPYFIGLRTVIILC